MQVEVDSCATLVSDVGRTRANRVTSRKSNHPFSSNAAPRCRHISVAVSTFPAYRTKDMPKREQRRRWWCDGCRVLGSECDYQTCWGGRKAGQCKQETTSGETGQMSGAGSNAAGVCALSQCFPKSCPHPTDGFSSRWVHKCARPYASGMHSSQRRPTTCSAAAVKAATACGGCWSRLLRYQAAVSARTRRELNLSLHSPPLAALQSSSHRNHCRQFL